MRKNRSIGLLITFFTAVISFMLSSCKPIDGYFEYEFNNKTRYSITVSILGDSFKPTKESSEQKGSFYLYSNSSKTIYIEADSVNYKWDASSSGRYIYSSTNGSTVTFRER